MFFYVQKYMFNEPWNKPILLEGVSDLTLYILVLRLANEMNKKAGTYERYVVLESETKPDTNLIFPIKKDEIDFLVKHE
ncbi:MAG: hypothetical protein M1421_08190 [Candidatus Eremiobacteraeota bacterium]|nr:hypothetical protein [Candidatus Eremiobacteraeota bacterium]